MLQANIRQALRIVDANFNRVGEGLRLLEDVARFILNDAQMSQTLKNLRHELAPSHWQDKEQYLSARDAQSDVGANIAASYQAKKRELAETIVANARRVEEALRVMEELAKVPGISLDSQVYQAARFKLYTIEKQLVARLLRQDKTERICGLYAIIDTDCLKNRGHIKVATEVLAGGAQIIQLRDKTTSKKKLLALALELKKLCAEHNALFIINDHLDIALAAEVDGLHLGQDDLPVAMARRLLPIDKLIGCSVTSVKQAKEAQADGADYLACGAVYATSSKADIEVIGLDILYAIKKEVALPLVAIGGISQNNVSDVVAAGADAVAVISAILSSASSESSTREIIHRLELCHETTD